MIIEIKEGSLDIRFRVNEDKTVELVNFSALPCSSDMKYMGPGASPDGVLPQPFMPRQFLSVHVTGESSGGMHAYKHDAGSVAAKWKYVSHSEEKNAQGNLLKLTVRAENGLAADYFLQTYAGLNIVRTWSTLRNEGSENIGIEYVSSFMYEGIGKNRLSATYDHVEMFIPHNGWDSEAEWQKCTAVDLGVSHMPSHGFNLDNKGNSRTHYGSHDSWSTSEYLPVAIAKDTESGEVWFGQVESSGAWEIEYGQADGQNLYVCLLGPNDESEWWKNLQPGQSFTTVPAAFGTAVGSVDEALAQLTMYRRRIRRPNPDDENCYVIFNDYMNCLFGDPTEEKEKQIIDIAAKIGCEYYCMDCGWYDKGVWWDTIGEWKESPERFPHGLKSLYEYARSKGLKMGMWLEIENMGVECKIAKQVPDNWFICSHGKRRIENNRYELDFRNPEVRKYCSDVVDRLIADYGCEYFKIDYNVTTGYGSDLDTDSRGDAMLEHYRALHEWIRSVYEKHPNLIIENCCSGAQRMDYGMLSLHSLQSTSDQTDMINAAHIATNVVSAVTPEQGGLWVYPYEDNREHVIFNMVNGLLLRPYISGMVWDMSQASLDTLAEGIALYKQIRGDVKEMVPFLPLGFTKVGDHQLAYGLRNEKKAYISVFTIDNDRADIPLPTPEKVRSVKVIYPDSVDCRFTVGDGKLHVEMPQRDCARLFQVEFE